MPTAGLVDGMASVMVGLQVDQRQLVQWRKSLAGGSSEVENQLCL